MKFITIIDPAIDSEEKHYQVFTEGQKADVWIKWPERKNLQFNQTNNRNMLGYVWPYGLFILIEFNSNYFILGKSVFPDYFYPPTKIWWKNQILNYHKKIKFDALWIDMK